MRPDEDLIVVAVKGDKQSDVAVATQFRITACPSSVDKELHDAAYLKVLTDAWLFWKTLDKPEPC